MARHHTLQIVTPEGIAFSLRLASPFARLLAVSVDVAVMTALQSVVVINLRLLSLISGDIAMMLMVLGSFAIQIGYSILLEWRWRGQTLGKRLLHLRVVDERGLKLQFHQVVIRNLLRFVDALPYAYLVGGVTALLNRRAQRLGDLAAGTIVVREAPARGPDLAQLNGGKYNSFRAFPHLEARLRQRATPAEVHAAVQALLRRESLEAGARMDLFKLLADRLRAHAEFPPEAVADLSDEQYVRNAVDCLYRRPGRTEDR